MINVTKDYIAGWSTGYDQGYKAAIEDMQSAAELAIDEVAQKLIKEISANI